MSNFLPIQLVFFKLEKKTVWMDQKKFSLFSYIKNINLEFILLCYVTYGVWFDCKWKNKFISWYQWPKKKDDTKKLRN